MSLLFNLVFLKFADAVPNRYPADLVGAAEFGRDLISRCDSQGP